MDETIITRLAGWLRGKERTIYQAWFDGRDYHVTLEESRTRYRGTAPELDAAIGEALGEAKNAD